MLGIMSGFIAIKSRKFGAIRPKLSGTFEGDEQISPLPKLGLTRSYQAASLCMPCA
jgi:hypothetical protein